MEKYKNKKTSKYLSNMILSYRLSHNLSQNEFARRLHVPQSTIARIEAGETGLTSKTLLKFINAMDLDVHFVDGLSNAREESLDVFQVCSLIISECKKKLGDDYDVTNMKLNKLLYYVQMFNLGEYGKGLFSNSLQAWKYGPVCPEIYETFKKYGSSTIKSDDENLPKLARVSSLHLNIVSKVINIFGTMSAYQLRDRSHKELPWINGNSRSSNAISEEDMVAEYVKYSNLLKTIWS